MKRNKIFAIILAAALTANTAFGIVASAATRSSAVPAIAAGNNFAFAIDKNDDAWAWGTNSYGQLAIDAANGSKFTSPTFIEEDVAAIAGGASHMLLVDNFGTLYSTGSNGYGQLGHRAKINSGALVEILDGVVDVACGDNHSLALTDTGELYVWGRNDYSQLGNGKTTNLYTPTRIMTGVSAIAADGNVSMALKTNGDLYVWGQNNYYQVGNGKTTTQRTPLRVLTKVKAFDTSGRHCLAVNTSGYLYAWGYGAYGQLGNGKKTSITKPTRINAGTLNSSGKAETSSLGKVKSVSAGSYHSVILLDSARAYVTGFYSYSLDSANKLLRYSTSKPRLCGTGIVGIESGDEFFFLVGRSGTVYSRGVNTYGQLGNATSGAPVNSAKSIKFVKGNTPQPTPTPTVPTGPYNGATLTTTRTTTPKGNDGKTYTVTSKTYTGRAADGNPFQVVEVSYGTKEALAQVIDVAEFAFTQEALASGAPWSPYGVFLKNDTTLLWVRGTVDASLAAQLGVKMTSGADVLKALGQTRDNPQSLNHRTYGPVLVLRTQDLTEKGKDGLNYTYHITEYKQNTTSGTPFYITESDYGDAATIANLLSLDATLDAPARTFYLDNGSRQTSNVAYYLLGFKLIKTTDLADTDLIAKLGKKVTTVADIYKELNISTDRVGDVISHSLLGSVKITNIEPKSAVGSDGKTYSYTERSYLQQISYGRAFTVTEIDYGTKEAMRALIPQSTYYNFPSDTLVLSNGRTQSSSSARYLSKDGTKIYATSYLADVPTIEKLGTKIMNGADIYRIQGWPAGNEGQTITHNIFGEVKVAKIETKNLVGADDKTYPVTYTTYEKDTGVWATTFTILETSFNSKDAAKALIKSQSFATDNITIQLSDNSLQASSKAYYVKNLTLFSTQNLRDLSIIRQLGVKVETADAAFTEVSR